MNNLSRLIIILISGILISSCLEDKQLEKNEKQNINILQYVDSFIGKDGNVHTFPGVTMPIEMMRGKEKFVQYLDGDELDYQIAYLYNYVQPVELNSNI